MEKAPADGRIFGLSKAVRGVLGSACGEREGPNEQKIAPPKSVEFRLFKVRGPPGLYSPQTAHLSKSLGAKVVAEERKSGSFKAH